MTVDDPSRVDGWMAGTPPPVILRHDGGLRRGEAAGFNTRRKASGTGTRACPPATDGQPPTTMPIIFALFARPFACFKIHCNSDGSPIKPNNNHRKHKKTKTFGLVSCRHVPNRVARCAHNPALQKDQPPGGSAPPRWLYAQCTMSMSLFADWIQRKHHGYVPH